MLALQNANKSIIKLRQPNQGRAEGGQSRPVTLDMFSQFNSFKYKNKKCYMIGQQQPEYTLTMQTDENKINGSIMNSFNLC